MQVLHDEPALLEILSGVTFGWKYESSIARMFYRPRDVFVNFEIELPTLFVECECMTTRRAGRTGLVSNESYGKNPTPYADLLTTAMNFMLPMLKEDAADKMLHVATRQYPLQGLIHFWMPCPM